MPYIRKTQKNQNNMSQENENKQGQLNIELTEEIAEGTYANLCILTHSHSEFIADFVQIMPGTPKAKVKSRVILTPQHAKRLMRALADNIGRYEQAFGEIQEPNDNGQGGFPVNFGGPVTQA